MKANILSQGLLLSIFLLGTCATLALGQNKRSWAFTNNTGQAANDLHIELAVGTVPVNIVTNPNDGMRRAGGIFTEFPEAGSPSRHDYAGGQVANGNSITLQFKDNTRPRRWWWTLNGNRIGDIQGANSPSLASVTPMQDWRDQLIASPMGTGRTTGHIADLSVTNPTDHPMVITVGPCFIPSGGQHQSYVVQETEPATVDAGATVRIPLQGYCADIFTRPVPANTPLPPASEWITPAERLPLPAPGETPPTGNGWKKRPDGSGITTFPGADIPFPYTIDSRKNPRAFGSLVLDAIERISDAYDHSAGIIQTPFSGNPAKERETVIQQTFWMYTASLKGREYKVEDFARNTLEQYAATTGKAPEKFEKEEKEKLQAGINEFWGSFQATGAKAKVLVNTDRQRADYDNIDDPDDLPKLIRPAYDRYAAERALNPKMTHEEAMKKALSSKEARDKWSDTFKKIYEGK
ncbi:MAG: hypothetical protein H6566_27910 [Lewinellaceae bacterium]|nr:hypothetical protein [Lewinellaceae bacterium]